MSASYKQQERELEKQLTDHLAAQLNPQLGRSASVFEQMIQERRRQRWMLFAGGTGLIAAAIVIASGLWWTRNPPTSVRKPTQLVEKVAPAPTADEPRDIEQLVAYQTFDEGVENIRLHDNPLPVRRLRQDAIQQVEWFDPQDKSTIRLTVPRQQVILIAQETY